MHVDSGISTDQWFSLELWPCGCGLGLGHPPLLTWVGLLQPACRVYFPLHPARYEPVSTYLGPHSRRTHVPLVRHPPSLNIKANRNAPAIRRHRLAWEHQAKWQYTWSDARTWPTLFQRCDSIDDNGPALRQQCVLAICEMFFVQPITQL